MKVIRVGDYRIAIVSILAIMYIASMVTVEPIMMLITGASSLAWIVFEMQVILQTVLGLQRMIISATQPVDAGKTQRDLMKIPEPAVKLIDVNSGVGSENKTPQK